MVVYEAIDKESYKKIVDFVNGLGEESWQFMCWTRGTVWNIKHVEYLKTQRPRLHMFYVVDETEKIRGLEIFETRGENKGEEKNLTNIRFILDVEDRAKNELRYILELAVYVAKTFMEKGYNFAEGYVTDHDFEIMGLLAGVTVSHKADSKPDVIANTNIHRFTVDLPKFVEEVQKWLPQR